MAGTDARTFVHVTVSLCKFYKPVPCMCTIADIFGRTSNASAIAHKTHFACKVDAELQST